MKLNVLFFGATADVAGRRKLEIEVSRTSNAHAVFERILSEHPRLANHKLLYSINEQYASGAELLSEGDELAIFTAVSGG